MSKMERYYTIAEPYRKVEVDPDELEQQKRAFLAGGGKIEVVPAGHSTYVSKPVSGAKTHLPVGDEDE
jgi:hypothetical protein